MCCLVFQYPQTLIDVKAISVLMKNVQKRYSFKKKRSNANTPLMSFYPIVLEYVFGGVLIWQHL